MSTEDDTRHEKFRKVLAISHTLARINDTEEDSCERALATQRLKTARAELLATMPVTLAYDRQKEGENE